MVFSRRNMLHMPGVSVILLLLFILNIYMSRSAIINRLPGFPGDLPFQLETGYIGVGEQENVQLFYYFIESEKNPAEDPLILWHTGGPGCSGLSAILYEIGPIAIDYANSHASIPTLKLSNYSWTKEASIIFVDAPVGTGYSYANTPEGYNMTDTLAAEHNYEFLIKWLINHPKFLENPLYICGDSYAGYIVPLLLDLIYNGIELGNLPAINLKGYTLGNPGTDQYIDRNTLVAYAYRMGLLSNGLYKQTKESCRGNYIYVDPDNVICQHALKRVDQCLENVRNDQILDPVCITENAGYAQSRHLLAYEDLLASSVRSVATSKKSWCRSDNYVFSKTWANNKSVQKALHVREGTVLEWVRCNDSMRNTTYKATVDSVVSYHLKFSNKSCRALIYSGDHDKLISHVSTEQWIESLNLQIQSEWRPWYVQGQVAGYTMTYGQDLHELTYATLKGGGHTAPEYKPVECLAMIHNWFRQHPL